MIETGVMNKINTMVSAETFNYKIPNNEIEVKDKINKIVINSSNYSNLTVRTEESNKITATGSLNITTTSEEEAKKILK